MASYEQQVAQIRANLVDCSDTSKDEKEAYASAIVRGEKLGSAEPDPRRRRGAVEAEIRAEVARRGQYLRGKLDVSGVKVGLNSRNLSRFLQYLLQQLYAAPGSDFDSAHEKVRNIEEELLTRGLAFDGDDADIALLRLHDAGSPFWVAHADGAKPPYDEPIEHYAARAGLETEVGDFILLAVSHEAARFPRFADSGGYPFWRPGGLTWPIAECPSESGFSERVVTGVTLGSVVGPGRKYRRPF